MNLTTGVTALVKRLKIGGNKNRKENQAIRR